MSVEGERRAQAWRLLDAGDGRRLDAIGDTRISRPAGGALAPRAAPDLWKNPDYSYDITKARWFDSVGVEQSAEAGRWTIELPGDLHVSAGLLSGGQLGFYSDHAPVWSMLAAMEPGDPPSMLNLFASSGLASIVAARAGFQVAHVDALRAAIASARSNIALNGLGEAAIRLLLDDAFAFVRREARRRHRYQIILLDPPSFGRGPGGQTWKLSRDLGAMLEICAGLLVDRASSLILTLHSAGIGREEIRAFLPSALSSAAIDIEAIEERAESGAVIRSGWLLHARRLA